MGGFFSHANNVDTAYFFRSLHFFLRMKSSAAKCAEYNLEYLVGIHGFLVLWSTLLIV